MKNIFEKKIDCIIFTPLKAGISYVEKYFQQRKKDVNYISDIHGNLNFKKNENIDFSKNQIFRKPADIKNLNFSSDKFNIHYSPYNFIKLEDTINNIKKINPEFKNTTKAIILLRNPGERILEHHEFFRRNNWERFFFRDAVSEDNTKNRINNNWDPLYNYIDSSFYYEKVTFILENFQHVQIIFYEDLISYTEDTYKKICDFLSLKYIPYSECGICNSIKKIYNLFTLPFYRFFFKHSDKIKSLTDRYFSKNTRLSMLENSKKLYRNKILEEKMFSKEEIININYLFFHDDILKLYDRIQNSIIIRWIK